MIKSKVYLVLALTISVYLVSSCDSDKKTDGDFNELSTADSTGKINVATSVIAAEVIKSIPPPIELESIIKASGAPYISDMLNSASNYDKYNTNYLKAVNLGVYGADLAYINIYNHKEDALTYLNTVIKLSEDLKVGQFFDFETIKRIADNNNNLDSMLNITTSNFEKMNNYLQDQSRSNISMYMLTGGWLEALNIACKVGLKENNKQLFEKIGEQKIVLDQIILLLSFYKSDPNAVNLANDLDELKKIYKNVKIETIYSEPTMVEENGALVVKDNSKTTIMVSEPLVREISTLITKMRSKIVNI